MKYYILLILTSLLWATNFVTGKFLVGHTTALTLTDIRWGIAVICLIPIVYIVEKRLFPTLRSVLPLLVMAATGVIFFNVFTYLALTRTTADNVGLLTALNPVAIALASFLILREKLSARQVLGMLISLIGVIVVVTRGSLERIVHFQLNSGDLLMLAAVACWGLYSVAGRWAMKDISPYMATLWSALFGVILALPFDLPNTSFRDLDTAFWVSALYGGIGGTVIAMVFWNIGVKQIGGTRSGIFLNFNPIFTAVLAFILLGEKIGLAQIIGTLLVITGVTVFSLPGRNRQRTAEAV